MSKENEYNPYQLAYFVNKNLRGFSRSLKSPPQEIPSSML
jgi:hypothetical protein